MARGKKKESALTPEEKLAQALVPDWEQPYKIPKNWCWIRQNSICSLSDGEKNINELFPYWEVKALRGTKELQYVSAGKFVYQGSKVILVDGENSGEVFDIPADGYMGSTFKALQISPTVHWDYLRFFISTKQELYRNNKKGSAIPHLNKELFFNMPLPLAPISEQQRIVDRIEYLFAKLDEAKEKAQSVLDSFETRKAAILHKAFTGELTAKWRAEHGVYVHPGNYPLVEVYNFIDYRGVTPDKTDSGVPLITAKNIKKGYIDYRVSEYISHETYLQRLGRGIARRNDLLFTTEAPLGNVALADQDTYSTAQRVIVLQLREEFLNKVNNKYVMYYMLDEKFQTQLQDQKTGSTVAGIKAAKLKLIPIVLPSADEQEEVVRILDSLFAKEQQAKEAAEAVLEKIDLLKKSILARAFRGELGTNYPAEESALELLKTIL